MEIIEKFKEKVNNELKLLALPEITFTESEEKDSSVLSWKLRTDNKLYFTKDGVIKKYLESEENTSLDKAVENTVNSCLSRFKMYYLKQTGIKWYPEFVEEDFHLELVKKTKGTIEHYLKELDNIASLNELVVDRLLNMDLEFLRGYLSNENVTYRYIAGMSLADYEDEPLDQGLIDTIRSHGDSDMISESRKKIASHIQKSIDELREFSTIALEVELNDFNSSKSFKESIGNYKEEIESIVARYDNFYIKQYNERLKTSSFLHDQFEKWSSFSIKDFSWEDLN